MKKLLSLFLAVLCLLILWGCGEQPAPPQETNSATTSPEENLNDALSLYQDFLTGRIPDVLEYSDIDHFRHLNALDYIEHLQEKNAKGRYAFFDMNGDGIPELHIRSDHRYSILTWRNGEMLSWASPGIHAESLNNGAVLVTSFGMMLTTRYTYIEYDFNGKEQLEISFGKMMANSVDGEWIYDENSEYWFESEIVSMEEWDALTEPYLSIGLAAIEWLPYDE